jgi:mannose-6-phosphate isomerase-like protein (cupin superfamily)
MSFPETTHHWNATTSRTILSTAETGGAMCIIDYAAGPLSGPPAHVHANEDEIFVVLEGEMEFEVGTERFVRKSFGTAFVPRGQEHSFRTGPTGARCLTILTPGGFEGFFAESAKRQFRMPQDLDEIAAMAARYGSRMTGPGLAQKEQADA